MTLMGLTAAKTLADSANTNVDTQIKQAQLPLLSTQASLQNDIITKNRDALLKGASARIESDSAHSIQANRYRKYNEQYYNYKYDDNTPISYADYDYNWNKYGSYSNEYMNQTVNNTLKWRDERRKNWAMVGNFFKGLVSSLASATTAGASNFVALSKL